MAKKEIELKGTNLSLVGRGKDSNGNQTVKLKFPNKKAFSIQTNANLPKTKTILSSNRIVATIGQDDLETIKDEVVEHITEYGSALQKRMLKAYFKAGGGVGKRSTHSINQDRRRLSKEPHEQAYKPKRKGNYFEGGGEIDIKDREDLKSYLIKEFELKDETADSFISSNSKEFKLPISYADANSTYKKLSIAKLEKVLSSDNPMITDAVKEKAKKKIEKLSKVEEVEEKIMFGKNTVHYVSRITLNNKDVEIGDKIILLEDITDKDILNNKKDVKIKISKSNKEILFPLSNLSREEPKKPKFKIGDSVMLKDGSMEMVIDSYKLDRSKEYVYSGHFKSKPSEKFSEKESELEVYNKKPKKYKLGDTWSSDFDYDGMMDYAEKVNEKTSLSTLEKLAESMTDVNYHEEAKDIYKLIDAKKKPTLKKAEPKKETVESITLKSNEVFGKEGFYAIVSDLSNNKDLSTFMIEPKGYKGDKYDGMQILFENGSYEVAEYQAGKNEDEIHIFGNFKSLALALRNFMKGNKRKPIEVVGGKSETKKPTPKKEVKAPKDSWKDKLAMLKGKKGYNGKIANEKKAVAGTKSRNIKRDLDKKALPKGKRISKNGKIYYESRANRSDIDPKQKFGGGGEVKSSGWGIDTSW